MPTYRVQCEAYLLGEFESEKAARDAFIRYVCEEEMDRFCRQWDDFITVEQLGEGE